MSMKKLMESKKAYLAVIFTQTAFAGMSLLSKAAFASGMNSYVFLFYRQAAGTLFLLPLTFFFKREEVKSLSLRDLCTISMLAFLGMTVALNAYGLGVKFTSATLGAAAFNSLPVTTFLFAVILRIEKVKIRKASGMATMGGIMLCISGVGVLAFYKGFYLKPLFNSHLFQFLHENEAHSHSQSHNNNRQYWIIGCFLLFLASISWGLWLNLQALVMKTCLSPLVLTCLQTLSSTLQSFLVGIAFERNPSHWKLGWNISLFAILYCGVVVICIANFLSCWVVKEKGPVFQAVTTPLNLIVTLIASQFLFNDPISFGSIIGAILLVMSLYSVLWGKSKEMSDGNSENKSESLQVRTEKEIIDQI